MSKLVNATKVLETAIEGTEAILTLNSDDSKFEAQVEKYTKACAYRDDQAAAVVTVSATEAKTLFADNEELATVTGVMEFGATTLSATVYREFRVDGSEDVIPNHVVFGCEHDFTNRVSDAVAGIFDEVEEAAE